MTRDEINAAVAKAKGWTFGLGSCSIDGCDTPHWRDADGLTAMNAPPYFLTPAASWAAIAEMVEGEGTLGLEIWMPEMEGTLPKFALCFGDKIPIRGGTLEEAVALAWLSFDAARKA